MARPRLKNHTEVSSWTPVKAQILGELGCTKVPQKFKNSWGGGGVRPVLEETQIKAAYFLLGSSLIDTLPKKSLKRLSATLSNI